MEPPIGLGPNGAMLYCLEYLESEEGWEWFREGIEGLTAWDDGRSGRRKDDGTPGGVDEDLYLIFDTPGQTELSTNHGSLKRILKRLEKELGIRVSLLSFAGHSPCYASRQPFNRSSPTHYLCPRKASGHTSS